MNKTRNEILLESKILKYVNGIPPDINEIHKAEKQFIKEASERMIAVGLIEPNAIFNTDHVSISVDYQRMFIRLNDFLNGS